LEVYPEACALVNSSNHRDIETATDHAIKQVLEMLYEFIDTLEDTRTDCTNRDDGALDERLRLFAVKYVQMDTKPQYLEHLLDFMVDSVGHDGSVVEDDELQMWVDLYAFVQYAFMLAEDEVDDVAVNSFLKAARTLAKDFVDHLKDFCLNHKALSHDYLNGLVRGAFPDMGLVFCQLLDEYSHYGKDFVRHIRTLLDESKNEKHRQLLDEDLASKEGHLEGDDREYLQVIGIDPALIDGIPHRDLFQQMKKTVFETYNYDAGSMSSTSTAASPGRRFAEEVMRIVDTNSYEARAAALGVATECIVPVIYTYFIRALEHHTKLTPTDYAFFSLHVKADEKHGDTMASIVADLAATDEIRAEMFRAVGEMMDARCRLWDGLLSLAVSTKHSNSEIAPDDPERLYDDTSSRWVRNNPNCLSDFTARPFFFTFCKPHVTENSFVLDLGCGEGYCTRGLRDFGPRQIIGIDLSGKMIDLARQQESCNGRIHYVQGNATDTQAILRQHFLEFDLMSQDAVEGCFDLVTAVFLFNYMSIEEMGSVGTQVFSLLKPGGRFVFTVPHPALKYWDRRSKKAPFYLNKEDSKGYFEDRNHRTSGVIFTRDGQELKIQSVHKTFSDYFKFVCELGFVVEQVEELGVDAKMMEDDPTFFAGVEGVPLHVAFKVIKPDSDSDKALQEMKSSVHFNSEPPSEREEDDLLKNFGATASALSGFLVPPKEVLWNCMDYGDRFVLPMPQVVVDELVESACMCIKKGIDHTNYMPGDVWPLTHVKRFGQECANRLMRKHGNLIIRGFDVDALADTEPERERLAKLCYYILMTCTGNIDVTRGRLFDVKDRSLDVHQDNVLFSATSQECGWHSDGSSRDWFPDMVCLLCIRPALEGGEFQIANTCNAFYDLSMRLPKFLMHELTRPLCRDIIEKGASSGFGSEMLKDKPESFWTSFSRQPNILRQRVRLNNYPIYERNEKTRQTKFRHLDHWLESGHMKAGLRISPLLKIATAELDKALHRGCRFDRRLERGEIAMANNHLVAHRRNAFSDVKSSDHHGRLLVRCWMKVEK
jgi:SAM-dependent methyltransferase